jgi:hypothetical protein
VPFGHPLSSTPICVTCIFGCCKTFKNFWSKLAA